MQVRTLRAAPRDELFDGLVVAPLVAEDGERFVRVAVFDPAENTTVPDHRGVAHHAVAVAAKHFALCPDPHTAVNRAAAELFSPIRHGMRNPLTTCVWVDVTAREGALRVRSVGRCGDGDVLVEEPAGLLLPLLSTPMWVPERGEAWVRWCNDNSPGIDRLWAERERQIAERSDYLCPPLGQFYPAAPEAREGTLLDRGASVVIATDGALLEELGSEGTLHGLAAHLVDILNRPSKWSHPDIALAVLSPAP